MADFCDGWDYVRFASRIARQFRYRTDAQTEQFLTTALETAAYRSAVLKKGETVWRAQIGVNESTEEDLPDGSVKIEFHAFAPERMKPLAEFATEGRVNPKGIPVLYVAGDAKTAMAEVRPSLASELSLAELEICRDVKLVDCSIHSTARSPFAYNGEVIALADREAVVWGSVNDAFRQPVDLSDRLADYAPTQVLAECFKQAGYGGIRYRSAYGTGGLNLALFTLGDAEIRNVTIRRVKSIHIEFQD